MYITMGFYFELAVLFRLYCISDVTPFYSQGVTLLFDHIGKLAPKTHAGKSENTTVTTPAISGVYDLHEFPCFVLIEIGGADFNLF